MVLQTKTITGNTSSPNWSWKMDVIENSINIESNTSSVTINSYLGRPSSASYFGGTANIGITCNRTPRNFQKTFPYPTNVAAGGWTLIQSETFTVEHNSDGTKEIEVSSTLSTNNFNPNSASASGLITLTTIPRASVPSIKTYPENTPDFNIGDKIHIYMNRKSDSFTHKVYFNFGSIKDMFLEEDVTNSCEFDTSLIASEMYVEIPNANVGVGTIMVETYNGETYVGSATCNFNACVVNSDPILGEFTYKDSNDLTVGITEDNQRIIRNNSNLIFNIGKAVAKNGAYISKYEVVFNEMTKLRESAGIEDFGTVNLSYNTPAILKVTDSRGNTTIKEITVIIDDWVLPTALISLNRKNNFYSETIIKVDATHSNLNDKNLITIQCQYKKVSDIEYSVLQSLSDNIESILNLDNNYQWNVKVIINDRIGSTVYNLFVDKGMPIAYFDRLKNSVGINTFPTDSEEFAIKGKLTVNNQDVTASDTLPIGAIVEYDGDTVPEGYEEVNDYSTDEIIVGTWIDGKPIYRKVITNTTTLTASSTYKKVSVLHSITGIGDVVHCYGSAYFNDYNAQKTFPSSITLDGLPYSIGVIDITSSNVDIQFGHSLTGTVESKIVLEYTKTTD